MIAAAVSREQMARNWQRNGNAPPPEPVAGPLPRGLNLKTVLDLGNTVFFTFRGRAYGIPPLAWRAGEQMLDAWLEAKSYGAVIERSDLPGYYGAIRRLQRLAWKHCRPTGPVRRLLRFFHLHRNPFRRATEAEVAELAVFMLGRRMSSHGNAGLSPTSPAQGTS